MKYLMILLTLLNYTPAQAIHVKSSVIDITTTKVTKIYGPIMPQAETDFFVSLMSTANIPGPRVILIDSPGGYVDVGQQMIDQLEAERARGVKEVCVVVGGASSMAFNLLTHCDVRLMVPSGHSVVHKIFVMQFPDQIKCTAKNLRMIADGLDKDDEPYRQANSKAMHMTLEQYDRFADEEVNWTAVQLLGLRYLNDIIAMPQ